MLTPTPWTAPESQHSSPEVPSHPRAKQTPQMTMAIIERYKSFLYHLLMVFPYNRLIEYDPLPQEHVFSHKQYSPEWLHS